MPSDSMTSATVQFDGPRDTPFEGGKFRMIVKFPQRYPYEPPSVSASHL